MRCVGEAIDWAALCIALATESPFARVGSLPTRPLHADRAQLEQALLNLLKNARESGSPPEGITLTVQDPGQRVSHRSRRPRPRHEPFYSTKRSGTGLGLALVREIVEAHGSRWPIAKAGDCWWG